MAEEFRVMCECFLCKNKFQFGPHAYDGRWIRAWEIMVCRICWDGNHDGIVPNTYPHLLEHLGEHRVEVRRNESGWIPWPQSN